MFDVILDFSNKVLFLITVLLDGLNNGVSVLLVDTYINDERNMV